MAPFILPQQAQVVRRLANTPSGNPVVDVPLNMFPSYLAPPEEMPAISQDESPRDSYGPFRFRYPSSFAQDTPSRAGERVETEGDTYELLGSPREVRSGRRVVGYEAAVLSLSQLYPFTGTVQEKAGVDILTITLALWSPSEEIRNTGGFEIFEAEAPVEFEDDLRANRWILIGTTRYHISRAFVPPSGPRVRMTLRKRDSSG